MSSRLEIRGWIIVSQIAYSVALARDGQRLIAGLENGVVAFDITGKQIFTYPSADSPLTVHRVATTPNMQQLYLLTRQGWLIRLDIDPEEGTPQPPARILYKTNCDLHSIALDASGKLIALGHLSSALTLLRNDGRLLWRQHPEDDTAPEESVWAVTLDAKGETLYAGSAGATTNCLICCDAQRGTLRTVRYLSGLRVTAIAALPKGSGVAAVLTSDVYTARLVAYDANLSGITWEQEFGEPITALATDNEQPILAASVGYEGQILLLDSRNGRLLAPGLDLRAVVNGLSIAQGHTLAAATQDGNLVLIRYFPEES